MCGWFSAAIARASCSKRRTRSASSAKIFRQDLDRHVPPEARIARLPHLTHSAFAQLVQDSIGTEGFTDHVRRVLFWASARPRRSSRARSRPRTEAGPPAPIGETTSYGPRRVPGRIVTDGPGIVRRPTPAGSSCAPAWPNAGWPAIRPCRESWHTPRRTGRVR